MNIIAIDPHWAKPYAFCEWIKKTAIDWGMLEWEELHDRMQGWAVQSDDYYEILIEEPYLGMNISTLSKLAYSVGMVFAICEEFGIKWHFVKPMHWKRYWGLTKLQGKAYETRLDIILPDKIPSISRLFRKN